MSKRAVSVSLGSSKRDKAVQLELLSEQVSIERRGTDGDLERAALVFKELDGNVDAFGVGGADLGLMVDDKWYPLYSVLPMVRYIEKTPVVDGSGLKNTLEYQVGEFLEQNLSAELDRLGRRVLFTAGADRWGMSMAFVDRGYEYIFGDLMFGLGLPFPVRSVKTVKWLVSLALPVVGRLPLAWLYPTGEKQDVQHPKWEKYYQWATVIAGDRHYIVHHMPPRLEDKVIVTNTTTADDVEIFRRAGVRYLVTTTPVLAGRSFGTNMMEAALVAAAGRGRKLSHKELAAMLEELKIEPQIQRLN
ncbi:MAG TPA: hypothetical protein VJ768_02070 [Anaerolineales bacterium]|nr:hypothetical protein [Anaerolineales bacterium]